jgi:hypothetical protein
MTTVGFDRRNAVSSHGTLLPATGFSEPIQSFSHDSHSMFAWLRMLRSVPTGTSCLQGTIAVSARSGNTSANFPLKSRVNVTPLLVYFFKPCRFDSALDLAEVERLKPPQPLPGYGAPLEVCGNGWFENVIPALSRRLARASSSVWRRLATSS